jgi:Zn-dependent M16 (insulinase) family peptidase
MNMKNYILQKKEMIEEMKTTAYLFEHEKTKAKIIYLSNSDDNKVFLVGFRTPAPDDTGVPHILEHSVLCGSRKFPIKDPFMELVKGSLQTFLNAMTFPDKTIYPVASRNQKDFLNLMNVYMDAVLYPRIYSVPEILKQEGWHYQLKSPKDTPAISGVVYNEMKGAFSSPESVLFREILHTMFPDTSYKNESGGIPESIPNLTQEDFLAFHKRYYHPSNSYILVYGDGNIEEHLQFLHNEYLQHFDYQTPNSDIEKQKPFSAPIEKTHCYPISPDDSIDDKTYLSQHYVIGTSSDPINILTLEILNYILLDSEAAILKKALLDAGIGKDIFGSVESDVQQPVFSIIAKNARSDQKEAFQAIVQSTLERIVENGIDKDILQAAINSKEFSIREADFGGFPKGLVYSIYYILPSWLYNHDPFLALHYESSLKEIKKMLSTRALEEFIQKNLLHNSHSSLLILEPKPGLNEEKQNEFLEKMQSFKNSLSEAQIQQIIEDEKQLEEFQKKPDSPQDIASIPMLKRSDVKEEVDHFPLEIQDFSTTSVHYHNIDTNGILYQTLYFNLKPLPLEDLQWVGLLFDMMGKMDTTQYTYDQLDNQINIHTGGIDISPSIIPHTKKTNEYQCLASVSLKVLQGNTHIGNDLLLSILHHTLFTDSKRLLENIQFTRSRIEMSLLQRGHAVSMGRIQSYWSESAYISELVSGISYYLFLKDLEKTFQDKVEIVIQKLTEVANRLFSTIPMIASITCSPDLKKEWEQSFASFQKNFHSTSSKELTWSIPLEIKNEGFITPGNVQYVAQGYNFKQLGYEWSGQLNVLRTIVSHNYLYENVRVMGGAYGAFSVFRKDGSTLFGSYRDPNLVKTLETYQNAYQYIQSFQESETSMNKFIIGTIGSMDTPLTPASKGTTASILALSGITPQDRQIERNQVLQTTPSDIQKFAKMVQDVTNKKAFCVIGNESVIKDNKDLFKEVIKLI